MPNLPPTQFKPSINLLSPFLIASTIPPIWLLILLIILCKPSRIFVKIPRTLLHKRLAIPTVLSLMEFQIFDIQFLKLLKISFVAFHKLVNFDLTPLNNDCAFPIVFVRILLQVLDNQFFIFVKIDLTLLNKNPKILFVAFQIADKDLLNILFITSQIPAINPFSNPPKYLTTPSILPTNHNWIKFHINWTTPLRIITIASQTPRQSPVNKLEKNLIKPSMIFKAPCITPFIFSQVLTIKALTAGQINCITCQIANMIGLITKFIINSNIALIKLHIFWSAWTIEIPFSLKNPLIWLQISLAKSTIADIACLKMFLTESMKGWINWIKLLNVCLTLSIAPLTKFLKVSDFL